jgi:hypothetical protein
MKLGAGAVIKSKVLLEQLDLMESLCNLTPAILCAQVFPAYRTHLNVAGPIHWFNGDSSITTRSPAPVL